MPADAAAADRALAYDASHPDKAAAGVRTVPVVNYSPTGHYVVTHVPITDARSLAQSEGLSERAVTGPGSPLAGALPDSEQSGDGPADTMVSDTLQVCPSEVFVNSTDDLLATQGLAGVMPPSHWGVLAACGAFAGVLAVIFFFEMSKWTYDKNKEKQDAEAALLAPAPAPAPSPPKAAPSGFFGSSKEASAPAPSEAPAAESTRNPNRWKILAVAMIAVMGADFYMGMVSPFFAGEAGVRGATTSEATAVIALFSAGGILSTLFVAPYLLRFVPPNRLSRMSLLLNALLGTCQGLGAMIGYPPADGFVAFFAIMRFFEGITAAVTEVCVQTMIMRAFDLDELAKALATLTGVRSAVGLATAPIGAGLYSGGGFSLPFLIGAVILLVAYGLSLWLAKVLVDVAGTPESKTFIQVLVDWRMWTLVIFLLLLYMDSSLYPALMQIWFGGYPYCQDPAMISVIGLICFVGFAVGMGIITGVAPLIGYINAAALFSAMGFVVRLGNGKAPPVFPDLPQDLGTGLAFIIPTMITNAPLAVTPPWMAYYLNLKGMTREETNTPVGSLLITLAYCGNVIGPLVGSPVVDAVGTGMTYTIFAGVFGFGGLLFYIAFYPWSSVKKLEEIKEEEKAEDADKQKEP